MSPDDQPFAFIWHSENKKYLLKDGLSQETLLEFLDDYKKDNLKVYYKSEQKPEKDYEDKVKNLVGRTFKETIDSAKYVLVQFYAPWCGHCRTLAPEFKQVAEHFAKDSSIIIAQLDATKNEVEGQEISQFPTIKLFTGENPKGIEYKGSRDAASLVEFVKSYMVDQNSQKHDL